jgi:hypothetical protein
VCWLVVMRHISRMSSHNEEEGARCGQRFVKHAFWLLLAGPCRIHPSTMVFGLQVHSLEAQLALSRDHSQELTAQVTLLHVTSTVYVLTQQHNAASCIRDWRAAVTQR